MIVEIFVAPRGCPSCGHAQQIVSRVTSRYPEADVRHVHILDAPERVEHYNVFTTPFIVIDAELAFVGVPREAELDAYLSQRRAAAGDGRPVEAEKERSS